MSPFRVFKLIILLGLSSVLYTQQEADRYRYAYFAGGDFWFTEDDFENLHGVIEVLTGYAGGKELNPSREDVAKGLTGHREAVRITYDYNLVTYEQLLDRYIRTINPTDAEGSFSKRGVSYTAAIYYTDDQQKLAAETLLTNISKLENFLDQALAVSVERFRSFVPAELAYQDFAHNHPFEFSFYRIQSGRDQYIKKVWSDVPKLFLSLKNQILMETPYFLYLEAMAKYVEFKKPSTAELKSKLSPLSFKVTQERVTEQAFLKGNFYDNKRRGLYVDIISGEPLFSSSDKLDSVNQGWPIFSRPIHKDVVVEKEEILFFRRTRQVHSRFADSYLGTVFTDANISSGLRYVINGSALRFVSYENLDTEGYGSFKSYL